MVLILERDGQRRLREHDEHRLRYHELAKLIAIAVNAPDQMPEFQATGLPAKPAADGPITSDTDLARGEAYFFALALKSGGTVTHARPEEPA